MAYSYDIAPNAPDAHDQNPYWLATFVRMAVRQSFNRDFSSPGSVSSLIHDPVQEDSRMVVANDIVAWNESSSKSSHVSNLSLQLIYTGIDYTAELAPDDWVLFWAFDNRADFERVKAKVEKGEAANGFNDGLKFVGRVDGVRKLKARDPRSGALHQMCAVTANGFAEFDSTIYYNEAVTRAYPNALQFMADFGLALNRFILGGSINPQYAIPELLNICLGIGPGEVTRGVIPDDVIDDVVGGDTQRAADLKEQAKSRGLIASPNRAYRIPSSVAKLLGVSAPIRPVGHTYADILRQVVGIQRYTSDGWLPVVYSREGNIYHSPIPLDGKSLPYPVDFNQRTVWSVLSTYLNGPINEMYTCLRVDDSDPTKPVVLPTFVCRQLPLSSDEYYETGNPATPFLSLPRWNIDERMIQSIDVGRSNAQRFNYVFIQGQDQIGGSTLRNLELQYMRNPPITDEADIMRSGLRMYVGTVSGNLTEVLHTNAGSPGARWSQLMADILMGGHLRFTGSVTLQGVQAPICEGDNAVVDGVVYHIERIQHSGHIAPDGSRAFMTTLQLSHGISISSEKEGVLVYPDMVSRRSGSAEINGVKVGLEFLETRGSLPDSNVPVTVEEE